MSYGPVRGVVPSDRLTIDQVGEGLKTSNIHSQHSSPPTATDTMESAQQQEESSCFSCGQCWEFISVTAYLIFETVVNFFSGLMGQDQITVLANKVCYERGTAGLQAMIDLATYGRSLPQDAKDRKKEAAQVLHMNMCNLPQDTLRLLEKELEKLVSPNDERVQGHFLNFAIHYPLEEVVSIALAAVILEMANTV